MPSWNELLSEYDGVKPDDSRAKWIQETQVASLKAISSLRGDRHVLFYGSAFLQKPQAPAPLVQIAPEDINGFMSCVYGMKCEKGLTLILHTPGGVTNAAETIVAYLTSKFSDIEVIVPTFAMSAGTMISLASDRIVMGRQSQLGPIDPQFLMGSGSISAQAVVDQFDRAKREVLSNVQLAHVWAPILQSIGPALLQEAQNAIEYGEKMVAGWLKSRMFSGDPAAQTKADAAAHHFSDASTHKSHGRRIDREEARSVGIVVEDLEANQKLQESVLTAYHVSTIAIQKSAATKFLAADTGRLWLKNWASTPKK